MTLNDFLTKYNGKYWDFDGSYGAQCFDLFQFYNRDVVGGSFVMGNGAVDIWNTYPKALYEQIANKPDNFPTAGDVVIWGTSYGPFGHVAIATEGDTNKFTCLSQNDPTGAPSGYKTYTSYKGVLGWLRPKQVDTALQSCLKQHTELVTELETLKQTFSKKTIELQSVVEEQSSKIGKLNTTLLTTQQEVKNREEQVVRITKSNEDTISGLNEKIKALTSLIDDTGAGIATYKDRIATLEGQLDNEAKEKGKALLKVSELEGKLKEAVNLESLKLLSLKERLKVCLDILL